MNPRPVRDANDAGVPVLPPERFGTPVMIPGAFEIRASPRAARPIQRPAVGVAGHTPKAAASDRERLEREREGGGAPAQRAGGLGTIGVRLWRRFRR